MATIGKNIACFRRKLGLTQEELSEKMNVTAQAVSKWENDLSYPDLTLTKKLADILGVTADELLNGETAQPTVSAADKERIMRRILVIRVEEPHDNTNIIVRFPLSVLHDAHENGTLQKLIGHAALEVEAALKMAEDGVTGPIVEVNDSDTHVSITVEDYEN